MAVELIRQRQTPTWTWAASSTVSQDIVASGAITRIVLEVSLTSSGSNAAAIQEDGMWRAIQALTLKGNGGVNYFSMGDEQIGRMLHLLNMRDGLIAGVGHGAIATTNSFIYVLHFGSRPVDEHGRDNPFDLSAFIPAMDDNGLKLDWLTTANSVVDDTNTISSGTMYATIYQVLGTKAEIRREMMRQGVRQAMVPSSSYMSYAHSANFSDVSKEFDVPCGAYLRRIAVMVQDDTATRPLRADDEVTHLALKLPVGNQRVFYDGFPAMVYQQGKCQATLVDDNATTGGALAVGPGFAVMDLREQGNPDYGLNLQGYTVGAVKLGATIANYASGDDSFYWFDQVRPYRL